MFLLSAYVKKYAFKIVINHENPDELAKLIGLWRKTYFTLYEPCKWQMKNMSFL